MPASTRSADFDNAFIERTLRLRDHRLDEFAPEPFEACLRELSSRLDRLSVFPDIKPFTRLLAETAGRDETFKPRSFARLAENFCDVCANVEADVIGKLDRPHRHPEGADGFVDLLLVLALLQPLHGGEHVGCQHLIDEEARHVLRDQREFADRRHERGALSHFVIARRCTLARPRQAASAVRERRNAGR